LQQQWRRGSQVGRAKAGKALSGLLDSAPQVAAVNKTVIADRRYIDYTHENFGVRVRENTCQRIEKVNQNSAWFERGPAYTIPIDDRFQKALSTDALLPPLWVFDLDGLEQYETGKELKKLMRGELAFKDAVTTI
jgi:hypothetical protein